MGLTSPLAAREAKARRWRRRPGVLTGAGEVRLIQNEVGVKCPLAAREGRGSRPQRWRRRPAKGTGGKEVRVIQDEVRAVCSLAARAGLTKPQHRRRNYAEVAGAEEIRIIQDEVGAADRGGSRHRWGARCQAVAATHDLVHRPGAAECARGVAVDVWEAPPAGGTPVP